MAFETIFEKFDRFRESTIEALRLRPTLAAVRQLINDAALGGGGSVPTGKFVVPITFEGMRGEMPDDPSATYWMTSEGKEGFWDQIATPGLKLKDNNGTIIKSANDLWFRRRWRDVIMLSWFGLVAGDPSQALNNALKVDAVVREFNYKILHLGTTEQGGEYFFRKVPYSGLGVPTEEEASITFLDRNLELRFSPGVQISHIGDGVGFQGARGPGYTFVTLTDVKFIGPGRDSLGDKYVLGWKNLTTGKIQVAKPANTTNYRAVYNNDWSKFKDNGCNFWCTGLWQGICEFSNWPSNNISVYGETSRRINGPKVPVEGYLYVEGGGTLCLRVDNPEIAVTLNTGMKLIIPGYPEFRISSNYNQVIFEIGANSYPELVNTTLTEAGNAFAYGPGNTLFADHIIWEGTVYSNNSLACGISTVGDECNANKFSNFNAHNCGGPAISERGFLGNEYDNFHVTASNERIFGYYKTEGGGKLAVDENGDLIVIETIIPCIEVVSAANNRSTFKGYYESGNQNPPNFGPATVTYEPGFYPEGATGGTGEYDGVVRGKRLADCGVIGPLGFAGGGSLEAVGERGLRYSGSDVLFAREPINRDRAMEIAAYFPTPDDVQYFDTLRNKGPRGNEESHFTIIENPNSARATIWKFEYVTAIDPYNSGYNYWIRFKLAGQVDSRGIAMQSQDGSLYRLTAQEQDGEGALVFAASDF